MKNVILIAIALFLSLNVAAKSTVKEFVGTYNGITENEEYKFTDNNGFVVIIQELSFDVEIDLYDEEFVGKKFKVSWTEETRELYDDDGEETGESVKVKVITKLEEL